MGDFSQELNKQKQVFETKTEIKTEEKKSFFNDNPLGGDGFFGGDDAVPLFATNTLELDKRMEESKDVEEQKEINIAKEMVNTVVDINMVKKTRENMGDNGAGDPEPNIQLKKESVKMEDPINVMDVKNVEKELDATKLVEIKEQKKKVKKKERQTKKKEEQRKNHDLPEALKATLNSIAKDKRDASEFFANMRDSAQKLLSMDLNSLTDREEIFSTMADLLKNAILYRDKRPGSRIMPKGRQRARWTDALISGMSEYCGVQEPAYMANIMDNWQQTEMDETLQYPEHLKKWLIKQGENIPKRGESLKKVTPNTYLFYINQKCGSTKEKLANDMGWEKTLKESNTNTQYSRIGGMTSGISLIDVFSDGSPMTEEADEVIELGKEKMEKMSSVVPADRAEVLNPIIQKYLDFKLTPEMLTPKYMMSHIKQVYEVNIFYNQYQLIFQNDRVNAAYVESLPDTVKKKLEATRNLMLKAAGVYNAFWQSNGISTEGEQFGDDNTEKFLEYQEHFEYMQNAISDETQEYRIKDYDEAMAKSKTKRPISSITYIADKKIEGIADDKLIVIDNMMVKAAISGMLILNDRKNLYNEELNKTVDLDEALMTGGTIYNDELIKDIKLGAESQSAHTHQTLMSRALAHVKEYEPQSFESANLFRKIAYVKSLGERTEKLNILLNTRGDLTREQIVSIEDEINGNMLNIINERKLLENDMKDMAMKHWSKTSKIEDKEEKKKARQKAEEDYINKQIEEYEPPVESEEAKETKVQSFISRQKIHYPDFDEKWGSIIYHDYQRQNQDRLEIESKDEQAILNKYKKEGGDGFDIGQLGRQITGPLLKRVKYTDNGDFATKEDMKQYFKNQQMINALKNKDDAALTRGIKEYLAELYEMLPEITDEMKTEDYYLKNEEYTVNSGNTLFYSNIVDSKIPAVQQGVAEYKAEHPKEFEWLEKRTVFVDKTIPNLKFTENGYTDTGTAYADRFRLKINRDGSTQAAVSDKFKGLNNVQLNDFNTAKMESGAKPV